MSTEKKPNKEKLEPTKFESKKSWNEFVHSKIQGLNQLSAFACDLEVSVNKVISAISENINFLIEQQPLLDKHVELAKNTHYISTILQHYLKADIKLMVTKDEAANKKRQEILQLEKNSRKATLHEIFNIKKTDKTDEHELYSIPAEFMMRVKVGEESSIEIENGVEVEKKAAIGLLQEHGLTEKYSAEDYILVKNPNGPGIEIFEEKNDEKAANKILIDNDLSFHFWTAIASDYDYLSRMNAAITSLFHPMKPSERDIRTRHSLESYLYEIRKQVNPYKSDDKKNSILENVELDFKSKSDPMFEQWLTIFQAVFNVWVNLPDAIRGLVDNTILQGISYVTSMKHNISKLLVGEINQHIAVIKKLKKEDENFSESIKALMDVDAMINLVSEKNSNILNGIDSALEKFKNMPSLQAYFLSSNFENKPLIDVDNKARVFKKPIMSFDMAPIDSQFVKEAIKPLEIDQLNRVIVSHDFTVMEIEVLQEGKQYVKEMQKFCANLDNNYVPNFLKAIEEHDGLQTAIFQNLEQYKLQQMKLEKEIVSDRADISDNVLSPNVSNNRHGGINTIFGKTNGNRLRAASLGSSKPTSPHSSISNFGKNSTDTN